MELPPGGSGFDPPPIEIKRLISESWIGIQAMILHLNKKYSLNYQSKLMPITVIRNRPARLLSAPIIVTKKYEPKSINKVVKPRSATCTSRMSKTLAKPPSNKL